MSFKELRLALPALLVCAPAWSAGREIGLAPVSPQLSLQAPALTAAVIPAAFSATQLPQLPQAQDALLPDAKTTLLQLDGLQKADAGEAPSRAETSFRVLLQGAGASQPALGTPGVYSNAFHRELTNPRIRRDIEAGRFIRLAVDKDGRLESDGGGGAVDLALARRVSARAKTLPALSGHRGTRLVLVSGGADDAHPHLLAVTKDDFQLGHAGTARDAAGRPRGRFAYMTAELFADESIPVSALMPVLEEELSHARERELAHVLDLRLEPERFGASQLEKLERFSEILKGELASRPEAPRRGWLARAWAWLKGEHAPPRVPWSFKLVNGQFFYHGTTLFDLERIAESGGLMKAGVSQFSLLARDSVEYAGSRQFNLGKPDNPAVLLQFPTDAISGMVSSEEFRPAAALIDRGVPPNHQSYAAATQPIPLSLMTRASKDSILSWVRLQAAAHPENPRWAALYPKLKKAFDP